MRVFIELEAVVFSLATDTCGYIYAADWNSGEVYRIDPDGSSVDRIVDLPGVGGWYSGMRFGNGVGGFLRDHLYVTNRFEVFDITLGIPGKAPVYALP